MKALSEVKIDIRELDYLIEKAKEMEILEDFIYLNYFN